VTMAAIGRVTRLAGGLKALYSACSARYSIAFDTHWLLDRGRC
jgi:hypothetical protein